MKNEILVLTPKSIFCIKKNQKRNTNAGGAPRRGEARPPRSCYVFDFFFLHSLDPVLA